jgi:ankyrin repeat protein
VRELVEAATDGRWARAERLLALYPRIAGASFHAALVLGDVATAESHLARRPALAREAGGPRSWEPLHYVCYDSLANSSDADANGLVAIARRLLELGADPNDGVTLPMAASAGDVVTLELLQAHGANPNQPWATDGSATLYAILHWTRTPDGVKWLLAHGADPDPVFAVNGETPLHVAAAQWDVALVESLVQRGADVSRRRADGRTPYAMAELNGNREIADWLRAHGAPDDLLPVDRLVAACGRGDRAAAETLLAERPALRDEITDAHYATLHRAAEQGDVAVLALLLDCGFDPSRGDAEIGKTALHSAAMAGRPDSVRLLLARGASPDVRDREFNGQPLVWAAEGSRSHADRANEYAEVGRLLLRAGSTTEWQQPTEEPTEGIGEILAEWRRSADGTRDTTTSTSREG